MPCAAWLRTAILNIIKILQWDSPPEITPGLLRVLKILMIISVSQEDCKKN